MNVRRHLLEAATLVSAAVLCALVANGLASRERKLALVGNYPNALTVPEVSSKVNGAEATASATPATNATPKATPAAAASSKLPFKEKQPGPDEKSSPKASAPAQGSEARISSSPSSSPADLLKRFPVHNKPFVEISGDDAAWLIARGVLALDARRTKVYEEGHIAGARSFPVWESDIDARVTAFVGEGRDGSIPVVLYCSGGDCEDSHMLARKLFGAGFDNLLVYSGGWPDWQRRGGKGATGPES